MCGATQPSQMGAQVENSAVDALLRTIDPIAKAISQKKASNKFPLRPAVLTHDIEGAFNQVHLATLREVMLQRRMPLYLTNWVTAFNTDWKLTFGFDQHTEQPQPYEWGLPQGSPISPILFLIYSNAMLEKQHHPSDATDTSYVDDICMVQMSPTVSRANTLLEERTDQHLRGDPAWDSPLPPQKRNSCTASPSPVRLKTKASPHTPPSESETTPSWQHARLNTWECSSTNHPASSTTPPWPRPKETKHLAA